MTQARYSRTAMLLHWLIALALAFQLALGFRLEDIPQGVGQFVAYQLHKSVGITILLLSLARLGLRFVKPPPPALPDSTLNLLLARAVHWGFYLVMIGGPLTGWALVSTAKIKIPTLIFGLLPWPHLPLPRALHEPFEEGHEVLAYLGVALFVLHVAGALRHQFMNKEVLLERMMPLAKAGAGAAAIALFAVLGANGAGWLWPFPSGKASPPAVEPITAAVSPTGDALGSGDTSTNSAAAEPSNAATSDDRDDEPPANSVTPATANTMPLANWVVQPGSNLGFAASWNGTPVPGKFANWTADIRFSPDDLAGSRIRVDVDLASVSTSEAQYSDSLKGADFFDTAMHPRANFTSTKITRKSGDRYTAVGTLKMHGVERPVTLDFTLKIADDTAVAKGSTRLDRTAFQVGSGDWAATDQIAANVGVNFAFRARRMPK